MKFTDGYWMLKKGFSAGGAVEVRDCLVEADKVTLFVSSQHITNRGQTLGGPVITLEITSPLCDVIGVKAYHYKGGVRKTPNFAVNDGKLPVKTEAEEKQITIASGGTKLVINKFPFEMRYYYNDKFLTGSLTKQLAYISSPDTHYFRERLNISVGECIYGLGERFGHFVKNGQSVDIWNEDGGTASEQAYKNIPFSVSNRGYGVFVNHPELVSYEVGSEVVSKFQFSVEGESLNYFIIGGNQLTDVIANYASLTGKPALPPAWSFGLWLSTSFTTSYDEKTVSHFIDGMRDRDIPLSVFHFDCFWMKEYEWCNFKWDEEQFPDVKGMLKRIKEKGLRICVWINPYIGQKSRLFDEGMENGYFIKDKNGGVWQWDMWQPGMAIVDFTNPEAVKWYQGYLRELIEQGVDCFKTDFGERIPTDAAYYDGSDTFAMHNYYTYLYNKAVFDVLEECKGKGNAVLFARSATTGGQQFPVHWGGDCEANYESMAESLRGGLSLSLGAFGFWSHDISGFENTATADVYKRWVAFGLLSTHSRLHGSSSYRVPWLFDDEAVDVLRFFSKQKNKLMPYLFANACKAAQTGIPVMRPMIVDYQNDTACNYLDKQYILGDSLITSPIFNPDGLSEIYLPSGTFTHFQTNERVEGGRFISQTYDYFGLPLYVKPNSIIVTGKEDGETVYAYNENINIHLFEITDARTSIYDTKGNPVAEITAKRDGKALTIDVTGTVSNANIILHNTTLDDVDIDKPCLVDGSNLIINFS